MQLQRKLELQAIEDEKNGGKYIRPIVLFQAQPRNAEDNTTFEKLKEKLIELKIPAEQIKIKTANFNEIKEFDQAIDKNEIKTITDLESYMVVKERLIEG